MYKKKQAIHYCTILSAGQWDFLLKGKSSAFRQKCLHRLMTGAVRARTVYKIKGVEIVLEVGQVAASDVELSKFLGCNRKTIGKLIDSFNSLGMLTTRTNNRTSVHTLHFLTGWYVGGVLVTNPHYVRPSAIVKGQSGDVRTPLSDDSPMQSVQSIIPGDSQREVQDVGRMATSTAALSSSLCPSASSSPSANGQEVGLPDADKARNFRIIDSGERKPEGNGKEAPKEAQDSTAGGEYDPNIGKRN